MHVCLLNDSFPPMLDGVANVMKNYAEIIERRYGKATVVTPAYPGVTDDTPYPVIRYASIDTTKQVGYRTGYPFDADVIERVAATKPDLLHVHCPFVSALMGRVLREQCNVPMVFTYHTKFDIDVRKAVHMKLLQDTALKLIVENIAACDDVWVVSEGAGKNLRSIGYEGNYIVMPNGVDMPKGRADAAAIDAVRRQFGLDPSTTTYLFVGRMMWYKGQRLILDALRMLKNAGKPFCAVFVGDGLDRGEIEQYARTLGLVAECKFLGAIRDRETLRALYAASDLFLFPSTFDTNGIVVREAAANGLASVLIEGSCAAEGVHNGRTGLLIPETAEAMANVLFHTVGHRAETRALGERAMHNLYLSWEDSVQTAAARYQQILDNRTDFTKPRRWTNTDEFLLTVSQFVSAYSVLRALPARISERTGTAIDVLHPSLRPAFQKKKTGNNDR